MNTNHIRKSIIKLIGQNGGSLADNLSSADIVATLYDKLPKTHNVFVTNKLTAAWQAALAHSGQFSKRQLHTNKLPSGQEHALHEAIGAALATKDNKIEHTYCIVSDSEKHGQKWESIILAGTQKLNNLTLVVDKNNLGNTELNNLRGKFEAHGWNAVEIDGHNTEHIQQALNERHTTKPTAIIAHTIPGKGISFMENRKEWQKRKPTQKEIEKALAEL